MKDNQVDNDESDDDDDIDETNNGDDDDDNDGGFNLRPLSYPVSPCRIFHCQVDL